MGYTQKQANGQYRARWRDPDGSLRSKNFARERDAIRYLRTIEVAKDEGRYMDESGGKILFSEWAEHYFALAQKRLARTTYARDVTWLNTYVLPRWGRTPLGKITQPAVERWVADLGDEGKSVKGGTLAPTSVQDIYQIFRKLMRAAHAAGRIPKIPCPEHPPIARKKRKTIRFLAEAEIEHLANNITPLYETMIFVGAYGGFRLGELCALRVDDVDWAHGYIRVDEAITDVDGHIKFENSKSDRGFRTVPIAEPVLERLITHIEQHVDGNDRRSLLFAGRDGAVLRPNNWRGRHFNRAVSLAGLAPLTPHDLRHTAASLFIAEGANPWMLSEILGHGDTRMIDRVYGHLFEKDRQALRDRMSRKGPGGDRRHDPPATACGRRHGHLTPGQLRRPRRMSQSSGSRRVRHVDPGPRLLGLGDELTDLGGNEPNRPPDLDEREPSALLPGTHRCLGHPEIEGHVLGRPKGLIGQHDSTP